MKQGKKYISPGAWFSMVYPADWNEFEDGEGSFLFYNPNEWTGNFRISAYKGDTAYGRESVKQELKENTSATLVKIGRLDCAYSKEMFEEEGTYYTSHLWIAGIDQKIYSRIVPNRQMIWLNFLLGELNLLLPKLIKLRVEN